VEAGDPQNLEDEPLEEPSLAAEAIDPVRLNDEDRLLVVFASLGPLALVTMLAGRSEFVRWHGKQGILLAIVAFATFVALRPFHRLAYLILPFLGQLFTALEVFLGIGFLLVALLCMVRGLEGRRFRVPLLADLIDRF
jgi:uncharacterized membrane protein